MNLDSEEHYYPARVAELEEQVAKMKQANTKAKIKEITYERLHNLGNYCNARIAATVVVGDDGTEKAMALAKAFVSDEMRKVIAANPPPKTAKKTEESEDVDLDKMLGI